MTDTDTETVSHRNKDPAKVLRQQEEAKKRKYLIPCQQAHKHFTPLVYSVDGLEGKEETAMSGSSWRLGFLLNGIESTHKFVDSSYHA